MRNQVLYSIIGAAALFLVNACQKPVVNPPELKLPTTSFTDVSAAGDVVVVDYTLTNGVEGSEIKVDGDYDWAKVTAIKSASIEVTVDPNETTEPRTAEFDVTYPGVTKELSFSITQAAGEAPVVDAPVITLDPTSVEVPAAGESGGFNYEIANPVDDGAVTCSVLYPEGDAGGWITCDEADLESDGRINYEVSANEGEARTATIVVSYPGAEDVDFVISQAAAGGETGYDYEYTFETFFAGYFDNETIETADNYNFYMSDGAFEPGDVQYNFDLYTELASNGVLPAGTYTFDERTENYQPGTFSKFSNFRMAGEEADPVAFKGGTITISKDESGNYSFEAELTDANDKTHHVTYTGPMDFGGGDEPSDEVSYDFEYSYLTFYEGEGQNGEDNFFLALSDMPFNADGYETDGCTLANFDIYAAAGTSGVLPAGTYRFDDYNYTEGTFSVGSYIRTPEKDYIYFSDGTINVSESGDEYIFEATLTGNDGITYKVTYTGAIAEPEAPSEPVALEMKYHQVMYYEGYDSSQSDEFCLSLSDMPFADEYGTGAEGSYVAWLDIYAPNGTSGVLPEGTYNYDDSYTRPPMSFVSGSTITYPGEYYGVRVSDGTVEVSKTSDGEYTIEANLSLVDGKDYVVTYTGPIGESGGDDPDPVDVTFEINVNSIETNTFSYSIVPSDKEVTYFGYAMSRAALEAAGVYSNGTLDVDALYAYDQQNLYPMISYAYDMFVHEGDYTNDNANFDGDAMVVYCYAFDPASAEKLSDITYKEVVSYDYVMTESNVEFYDGYGGPDNYLIALSDKPFTDGYPSNGSINYYLDLYVPGGTTFGRELPEGEYVLDTDNSAMTLGEYFTSFTTVSDNGAMSELYFSDGSLNVSKDGDNYVLEGNFTDTEGNWHHFTYTGLVFPEIPDAIDCEATIANAGYMADSDGVMEVMMQLTDMTPVGGYVSAPGTLLTLDLYMPFNADGTIATGTYNVTESGGEEFTLAAGYLDYYSYSPMGTYLLNSPDADTDFSSYYVSSGSVVVSGSPDSGYSIDCNLVTEDGIAVNCSYEGPLSVQNMPVTEDFSIDLTGAAAQVQNYGDYYLTGGNNWMLMLGPASSGDAVMIDLVAEASDDLSAGIPSGQYTASATSSPSPGEFLPGYLYGNSISGTSYMHYTQDGIDNYTFAAGGTIDIVNNGDGTYVITFNCEGPHGNSWTGTWSGTLDTASALASYSTKSAKPSKGVSVKNARTVEDKVSGFSEFKAAGTGVQKTKAKISR